MEISSDIDSVINFLKKKKEEGYASYTIKESRNKTKFNNI